ncbi:hypothetical protein ONZ45_g13466 [Pleurotus djamor]|nr:hypothetical protein ONZ45_g13466 [Pleurotus djamor]
MFEWSIERQYWGDEKHSCGDDRLDKHSYSEFQIPSFLHPARLNKFQAYAYMPLAWSSGATLGPIIGGTLAHPVERFPDLFGGSDFLREHPYFLPCSVPATFSLVAWVVTFLFLEETSPVKHQGSLLDRLFRRKADHENPELRYTKVPSSPSSSVGKSLDDEPSNGIIPLRSLLTREVVIAAANYAILAFVDIGFRAIQPLFLSTPIELGGLGLSPAVIGHILSVFGVLNGIIQVFFFASIQNRWGSKRVFTAGIFSAMPCIALYPTISYLAQAQGITTWIFLLVWLQIVLSVPISLAYGAIFIFINDAAPNRQSLGAVNGLAQMGVSVMRAVGNVYIPCAFEALAYTNKGPAIANSLFALSIENHIFGGRLVYYVLIIFVGCALYGASLLPRRPSSNSVRTSSS